jgi:ABC-2 type transport system ATP-binding protein
VQSVEVNAVGRSYKGKQGTITALDDLTLAVAQGEIFGLLGPNGAGKTTLIKILSTMLLPDHGTASINGHDIVTRARQVRKAIGVMFTGASGLFLRLSARKNLEYFASLYAMPRRFAKQRIAELLDRQGLADRADDAVASYSQGMRQRLHLARALLHDPAVLLLDEPTVGLDPLAAQEFRRSVAAMRSEGKTVLFSTHHMHEAEHMCDRVAIVNKGRLVTIGSPTSLISRSDRLAVFELSGPLSAYDVLTGFAAIGEVAAETTKVEDNTVVVRLVTRRVATLQTILAEASRTHAELFTVERRRPTLEDVYVEMVTSEWPVGPRNE